MTDPEKTPPTLEYREVRPADLEARDKARRWSRVSMIIGVPCPVWWLLARWLMPRTGNMHWDRAISVAMEAVFYAIPLVAVYCGVIGTARNERLRQHASALWGVIGALSGAAWFGCWYFLDGFLKVHSG